MLYITGDTHGVSGRFDWYLRQCEHNGVGKDDYFIICGDFGYIFRDDLAEKYFLDLLESKNTCKILFVDGNHENFKALYSYPVEEWNGGKVHRIRRNIFHLMRGQVYNIDGIRIFTMGGAYSIDRYVRKLNVSYWNEELPSDDEYKEAVLNLYKHNKEIDIVLSHTAPKEVVRHMGYYPDRHDEELTGFLEWVMFECDYKKWYFGHWHEDNEVVRKHRAVYNDCIRVNLNEDNKLDEEVMINFFKITEYHEKST